jgi:hypothetical protein
MRRAITLVAPRSRSEIVNAARRPHGSPAWGALVCLAFAGCGDGSGPSGDPDPLHLAVIVRTDSASFRANGDFALDLVPSDESGKSYIAEPWTINSSLSAPTSISASTVSTGLEPADSAPVAGAILIDDSGSMRFSDPDRMRAAAAELFWSSVLPGRDGNQIALLDFGRGDAVPSPGFERTTLLVGFTSDVEALHAAVAGVQSVPGGATPLYQSGLEVVRWMDSVTPPGAQRILVVITDGAPTDSSATQALYSAAQEFGVRVFAVGVGAAAQTSPPSDAARLLQDLAGHTGGIYAAADPPDELQPVLRTLAQSASPERLLAYLKLTPIPDPGTTVSGTVSVTGARGTASATWSFVAP